jgi:hypothetical protein
MSPKIGMSLATRGLLKDRSTPAAKVNAAIQIMRDTGVPLAFGDYGVEPCPFAGGWCLERRRRTAGVNVVGALLLALQPEREDGHDDPGVAAAAALDVSLGYVDGLCDGWDCDRQSEHWLGNLFAAEYLVGYEAGMEARFRATDVCHCGARRFRSEETCPGCGKTHRVK